MKIYGSEIDTMTEPVENAVAGTMLTAAQGRSSDVPTPDANRVPPLPDEVIGGRGSGCSAQVTPVVKLSAVETDSGEGAEDVVLDM